MNIYGNKGLYLTFKSGTLEIDSRYGNPIVRFIDSGKQHVGLIILSNDERRFEVRTLEAGNGGPC